MNDLSNHYALSRAQARWDGMEPSFPAPSLTSPFLPKFSGVVDTAFKNFDPGTLDAICCQLLAGNSTAVGDLLHDYLLEVCQDGVEEALDEEARRDW
ncbi:hypothetical protein [Comamonas odontotermitis]|uniref:hypothetical protein n=1 Tax=Comamonas odontotermitis TaxID=379895 RepID=UPI001CC73FAE|nr:hypothetical protein [Comamonas odontotermitis]UBB15464.1 hypothetical protein LAD35_11315 [Comamonas odontotermitis]